MPDEVILDKDKNHPNSVTLGGTSKILFWTPLQNYGKVKKWLLVHFS